MIPFAWAVLYKKTINQEIIYQRILLGLPFVWFLFCLVIILSYVQK